MTTPNQVTTGQETKLPAIIQQFRADLGKMETQFKMALPAHIPVERFMRVVMTAVQNTPKLLACDRQSFFNACMKAAQDGLLPDGREGAIVPFGEDDEDGGRRRTDGAKATWMPMIAGLRKIARNSGEIDTWDVSLVYEGDQFAYELGDEPFIKHKPAPSGGLHRKITHAYSVCRLKDGGLSRDVMNIDEIEDIRKAFSRAKKGPWSNPASYGEMAKKTVARRHSKVLPKSTDLDRVLHRDDELYDFQRARQDAESVTAQRPANIAAAFDHFGADPSLTDETEGNGGKSLPKPPTRGEPPGAGKPGTPEAGGSENAADSAKPGSPAPGGGDEGPPKDAESYKRFARKVVDDAKSADALEAWFNSDAQRSMRNACGVTKPDFDAVQEWVRSAVAKLKPAQNKLV
jgi:recombination protein RecT